MTDERSPPHNLEEESGDEYLPDDLETKLACRFYGGESALAVQVLGALHGGPRRFSDLVPLLEGRSENNLTSLLKTFQKEGMVRQRAEGDGKRPISKYALTSLGTDVFLEIQRIASRKPVDHQANEGLVLPGNLRGPSHERTPAISSLWGVLLRAREIRYAVACLDSDLEAELQGIELAFVVDFSEILRFAHPWRDRQRLISSKQWLTNQATLRYLFRDAPIEFILIPAYIDEYRRHLTRVYERLDEDLLRLTLDQYDVPGLRERILRGGTGHLAEIANENWRAWPRERQRALFDRLMVERHTPLVHSSFFEGEVLHSRRTFDQLVNEGKLVNVDRVVPRNRLPESVCTWGAASETLVYKRFFSKLIKSRDSPGRLENNKTDAWALTSIHALNATLAGEGRVFLLVTEGAHWFHAALEKNIDIEYGGRVFSLPLIRTMDYFRLRMLLSGLEPEQRLARANQLRKQLDDLVEQISRLFTIMIEHPESPFIARESIALTTHIDRIVTEAESLPILEEYQTQLETMPSAEISEDQVGVTLGYLSGLLAKDPREIQAAFGVAIDYLVTRIVELKAWLDRLDPNHDSSSTAPIPGQSN